jgi:hypothetical protein
VEGATTTVAESGHCCWVPKSNHSKEYETKNKNGGGVKYILLEYMTFTCIFNKIKICKFNRLN